MPYISVTFDVSHPERSSELSFEQPKNQYAVLTGAIPASSTLTVFMLAL